MLVGRTDGIFGDAMFASDRTRLLGAPIDIDTTNPPYGGSHIFVFEGGHLDLINSPNATLTSDRSRALEVLLDVPFVDQNPLF